MLANVVLRPLAKGVVFSLGPLGIKVDVDVHPLRVGFPQGKIPATVDCYKVCPHTFVGNPTNSLLADAHPVGICHWHKVDSAIHP